MKRPKPARMAQYRKIMRRGFKSLLVLALIGMVFFGVRLGMMAGIWHRPATRQDPIAGWMTPRYVSRTWQVPPEIVAAALDIDGSGRRVTLAELAAEQGTDLDTLIQNLTAAVITYQAMQND
ncbi:hypothetical protein [Yoonia sp.]|uniref:hypothetical protein n=1 Tax=Yoonia sp. TaxID=2212373 RepID=UPI0019EC1851|nr:hypothetical protein [Yoonia sp.]MBE0412655.1 hypothetical protein [Yoonia sp.]